MRELHEFRAQVDRQRYHGPNAGPCVGCWWCCGEHPPRGNGDWRAAQLDHALAEAAKWRAKSELKSDDHERIEALTMALDYAIGAIATLAGIHGRY